MQDIPTTTTTTTTTIWSSNRTPGNTNTFIRICSLTRKKLLLVRMNHCQKSSWPQKRKNLQRTVDSTPSSLPWQSLSPNKVYIMSPKKYTKHLSAWVKWSLKLTKFCHFNFDRKSAAASADSSKFWGEFSSRKKPQSQHVLRGRKRQKELCSGHPSWSAASAASARPPLGQVIYRLGLLIDATVCGNFLYKANAATNEGKQNLVKPPDGIGYRIKCSSIFYLKASCP